MSDYYTILGVTPTATQREISVAYKGLVAKYHPDKHQKNDLKELAAEKLRQLNEAYAVLSNRQQRAQYDAQHFQGRQGQAGPVAGRRNLSRTIGFWIAVLVALPLLFRYVRNPKIIGAFVVFLVVMRLVGRMRKP